MKQILMMFVIAVILSGCQKQPEAAPAVDVQADVREAVESAAADTESAEDPTTPATDVMAADADESYTDEGQPNADVPLLQDHFRVMREVSVNSPDAIVIQKITNGELTVTDIDVNRGHCGLVSRPDPHTLDYSGKMTVYLWGCTASDVLEVTIHTDQGYITYNY